MVVGVEVDVAVVGHESDLAGDLASPPRAIKVKLTVVEEIEFPGLYHQARPRWLCLQL